jgi:hypothetical protein
LHTVHVGGVQSPVLKVIIMAKSKMFRLDTTRRYNGSIYLPGEYTADQIPEAVQLAADSVNEIGEDDLPVSAEGLASGASVDQPERATVAVDDSGAPVLDNGGVVAPTNADGTSAAPSADSTDQAPGRATGNKRS